MIALARSAEQHQKDDAACILVISNVRLYRDALKHLLAEQLGICVKTTVLDRKMVVARVRDLKPEILLLDVTGTRGFETARAVANAVPNAKIIALAVPDTAEDVIACAQAGIAGYVGRDASVVDLIQAICRAKQGELACSPRVAAMLYRRAGQVVSTVSRKSDSILTHRELEIMELIDDGLSNKEIANRLRLSAFTVKNHVHHILDKFGVHRRGEAASRFRTNRASIVDRTI